MGNPRPTSKNRCDSSSSRRLHEPLVFFLDRCLESKKIIESLAAAGWELQLHAHRFPPDCPDQDWLPVVAQNKWVLLTKDERIRRRPIEKQALLLSGARSFIITAGDMTGEEIADVLIRYQNRIRRISLNTPPPFMAAVTRSGVKVLTSG